MKLLANASIRTKFLLLPAIAALLMVVLGAIYVIGQRDANALQERINSRDVPNMRELSRLFSELSTNHVQFISLLASSFRSGAPEGQFYAAGRKNIIAVNRTIEELHALEGKLPAEGKPREIAQRLQQHLGDYRNQMGESVLLSSVDLELIARFMLQANEAYDAANSEFLALIEAVQEIISLESRALQASRHEEQSRFFIVLGLTIAFIAISSALLSSIVTADLTSLMAMLKRLSEGDTDIPQPSEDRRDEFGAVNKVIQAFRLALQRRDQAERSLKDEIVERTRIGESLRLSEERYTLAAQIGRSGAWEIWPAEGKIFFDGSLSRVLGYEKDELSENLADWVDTVPEDARAGVADAIQAVIDGRSDHYTIEHPVRRKDGSIGWVLVKGQRVSRPGETPLRLVGSSVDITERKRAEEFLQQLNEELEDRVERRTAELVAAKDEAERANLAKSEFLSRMSHELRTPLNAILGFGQLLELEIRAEEQADNVQEILHAGQHLLDLINEVLDLARIESGKFTISQEPVPLLPLIEDCLTLIRPLAEARGIRIIEAGRDCGEHVLADRVRLKQVLLNLLSNAVKYNREGGSLGIACVAQGDTVQIRISDSGPGLSAEQQGRLFVAFERLDADNGAVEGTGIGLALSKRLVELMDGEIGVESTPGSGSTFWVRLSTAEGHAGSAPETRTPESEAQGDAAGHKRWDVLCIEDNPANLRLIERILARRSDIRLLSASAPGLGLELAVAHRPALILLDINLPDMDGYAVLQCLRESPVTRDIPVVAISANAMPKDLARGKAAGFQDYLTKPLEVTRFLEVIDRELGQMRNDS